MDTSWRSLARFAVELSAMTDVDGLQAGVDRRAGEVLGADGCVVIVRAEDGGWRPLVPTAVDARYGGRYDHEPFDSPLPACRAAREGERFLVPDRAAAADLHPRMAEVVDLTGRPRWALVPLRTADELVGSLAMSWERPAPFDEGTGQLLDTFAAQCAPTLARLLATARAAADAAGARRLSKHLQRSSLAALPHRDGVSLAIGYRPAQAAVDIGGDWYDAFENSSGDLVLVLGDITGHDDHAAASMSQVRALLRGVVWSSPESPARLLQRLDEVMTALEPGVLATAVLAVVHDEGREGARVDWASAGHPTPLVRLPDQTVDLLRDGVSGGRAHAAPGAVPTSAHEEGLRDEGLRDEGFRDDRDPLLGVDPGVARHDHHALLAVGSALLLYSDGMVETRGGDLLSGLERLARRFAAIPLDDPTAGAQGLMAATRPSGPETTVEDDRTVLVAVVRTPAPVPVPGEDGSHPASTDPPLPQVTSRVVNLPADARSAGRARGVVERACTLSGWTQDRTATAVLLTSEIVTNALVHGRSESLLTVRATHGDLRVQVWDDNHRAPEVLADDDLALSGRGLHLVAACADEWGVTWPGEDREEERPTVGKGVWFTLQAR